MRVHNTDQAAKVIFVVRPGQSVYLSPPFTPPLHPDVMRIHKACDSSAFQGRARWLSQGAAVATAFLMASCGGGGGGSTASSTTPQPGTFSAVFAPSSVTTSTIVGYPQQVAQRATLTYTGSSNLYLVAEYDPSVVSSITNSMVSQATLTETINLRSDLAAGTYDTTIYLRACLDTQCKSEVTGSPASQAIAFTVLPNIGVAPTVSLQRTGADPAPVATVPVTVPPGAGTVSMTSSYSNGAVSATFDGSNIQITTTQVPSGTYALQLTLQGSTDVRYQQNVAVTYTVLPPPGGEHPLTLTPGYANLYVAQGGTLTQNIQATPPTWTTAWNAPILYDTTGTVTLVDLGNLQYQLDINTANQALGSYSAEVGFSAGPTASNVGFLFTWYVDAPYYFQSTTPTNLQLDATSTASALQMTGPVLTATGQTATWSVTNPSAWLSLAPSGGTTGVDALTVTIDPTFGGLDNWSYPGSFTLATNMPGTTPQQVQIGVTNYLPEIQRTVSTLNGTGGRIYVDGAIADIYSALLSTSSLSITGATLTQASYRTDRRFLGTVSELALDVTGASAGTPIQIQVATPLTSSQLSVAVQAPVQVASGFQALPFDSYRPAGYGSAQGAFYFSSSSAAYRWAESAGSWSAPTLGAVASLNGMALRQDEQAVYAGSGNQVVRLDPVSLAPVSSGGLIQSSGLLYAIDGASPAYLPSIQVASDGRAIAGLVNLVAGQRFSTATAWIAGTGTSRKIADLTANTIIADPGLAGTNSANLQSGFGLAASPSHHVVASTSPDGSLAIYDTRTATWSSGPALPAGVAAVGIDDAGTHLVRSDGVVLSGSTQLADLNVVVPAGYVGAGYALTQDGLHGLVYGYQPDATSGAQPATNGKVWVVDLSQASTTPVTASNLLATVALASPVGCTSATLATGETCSHVASLTVTPGSDSVIVLGPRGVAAAALPAGIAVPIAAAQRSPHRLTQARRLTKEHSWRAIGPWTP